LMRRHVRRLETWQLVIGLGKMCLAGAVLALVCWAANYWYLSAWAQLRFLPKLCELLIAIACAAAAFFSCAYLLRVNEVQDMVDIVRRRFN
jgi:peptidoglycan biosynthesis protein MviN/MurJ (putative lipid II flippase)